MKLQYIIRKHTSHIELRRDKRYSLGISVTDSHKDKGRPVIKNIKNGSLAQKSHCVAVGDVILSIGGLDAQGMRKADVKRLLKESERTLDLRVEYFTREACFGFCRVYCCQRMFISLKKAAGSFGFVLRSNDSKRAGATEYPIISNIKRGGPADREGNLMAGDRLLEVDNQSLSWFSLAEAAELLQEKNEAVFLVEYNVGLVDLSPDKPINLDIDCPDTNLGISVTTNDCSKMCIASVQQGSLAQRCGVFNIGDELLTVNGVDANSLTIPKAMEMLNSFRKYPGKLTIMHSTGTPAKQENKAYSSSSAKESLSTFPSKVHHVPPNTPVDSCRDSLKEGLHFNCDQKMEDYYNYQLKTMSILSEINSGMTHFHTNLFQENFDSLLSAIGRKDVNISLNGENFACLNTVSNKLTRLKIQYESLKHLTRELTFHTLKNATQIGDGKEDASSPELILNNILDGYSDNGGFFDEFRENLNEMVSYEYIGKYEMEKIISFISNGKANCTKCLFVFYAVTFAVQKVLLLLSLGNPNAQEERILAQTIESASHLCNPCELCKETCSSMDKDSETKPKEFVQTNRDYSNIPRPWGVGASSSSSETTIKTTENGSSHKLELKPQVGLDILRQTAIYKLTDVRNEDTDEDLHLKDTYNSKRVGGSILKSKSSVELNKYKPLKNIPDAFVDRSLHSEGRNSKESENQSYQFRKSNEIPLNAEKVLNASMPSVRPKLAASRLGLPQPHFSVENLSKKNPSSEYGTRSEDYRVNHPRQNLVCNQNFSTDRADQVIEKTHPETQDVSLKADRGHFGIVLGYSSLCLDDKNRVPIVIAIKPKSAAHRIGVLRKGDRILAMNGFRTYGLSVKELEAMKRELFSFSEIVIKVEFDVRDAEVTWGAFDVHLENNVKLGLVMNEPSNPSFVKGVVRGSATHRSGQIFPGDEVLSLTSLKEETLDLRNWSSRKNKTYRLTIRREAGREDRLKEDAPVSPHMAFDPKSLVQRGSHFNIKRTSIRTIEELEDRDKVILEHEFTLFRDPLDWDFGFLFGENPRTGKAYITDIRPGGPADDSKVIKTNDRILEVNGICVDGRTENSTMNLIMQADDRVNLVTRRVLNYK